MGNNGNSTCSSCIYVWPPLFTLVFVVLKLVGVIDWSWWWVVSPMLFGVGLIVICILIVVVAVVYDAYMMKHDEAYRYRKITNAVLKQLAKSK